MSENSRRSSRGLHPGDRANPSGPDFLAYIQPQPWMADALCREVDNGDAFYPERYDDAHAARRICNLCVVKDACLDYALANDEAHGVWGGLGARSRMRLKRQGRPAA